jgi:ApeA N-terminal domain 1
MPIKAVKLLEEQSEYRGYWWHPDDRNDRVAGTLFYSRDDGLHLELMGVLDGVGPPRDQTEIITLHGDLIEGDAVTLHRVFLTSQLHRWPGMVTQRFRVHYALLGAHIDDAGEHCFPSCSFRLSYLEEWLSYQPLRHELPQTHPFAMDLSLRTISGEFERVEYLDADIKQASSFDTQDHRPRSFGIASHSWLVVRPAAPKPLDWYLGIVSRIRDLMKLCLPQPTYIEELQLIGADNSSIILGYQQSPSARPVDQAKAWPVLPADQLGGRLASTISKWMELYDKANHPLHVFLIALFGPVAYIDERFLLLAKALEVYHRRKWDSYFMNPDEYNNQLDILKSVIPASFPRDLRHRICTTLQWLNEYPFGKRLQDLDADILQRVGLLRLPRDIRRRIVDTRNYLTHYSEGLKPQVKYGKDMHDLNERMIAVMIVLLFDELGVPQDAVRQFLQQRNNLARFLKA